MKIQIDPAKIAGLASPNDCPSRNRLQVADDILPALRAIPLQLEVNVLCCRLKLFCTVGHIIELANSTSYFSLRSQ